MKKIVIIILIFICCLFSIDSNGNVIKSNLGARGIAYLNQYGNLPYNAEVEYLEIKETSGLAYINTGLIPDATLSFEAGARIVAYANSGYQCLIGCGWGNWYGSNCCLLILDSTLLLRSMVAGSYKGWRQLDVGEYLDIEVVGAFDDGKLTIECEGDTWTKTPSAANLATWRTPIHIFCGTVPVANTDEYDILYNAKNGSRIYYFKAQNSTISIDLIPVHFINELGVREGAMYDRVSGKLFRNCGTGSFIIGPDKE